MCGAGHSRNQNDMRIHAGGVSGLMIWELVEAHTPYGEEPREGRRPLTKDRARSYYHPSKVAPDGFVYLRNRWLFPNKTDMKLYWLRSVLSEGSSLDQYFWPSLKEPLRVLVWTDVQQYRRKIAQIFREVRGAFERVRTRLVEGGHLGALDRPIGNEQHVRIYVMDQRRKKVPVVPSIPGVTRCQ